MCNAGGGDVGWANSIFKCTTWRRPIRRRTGVADSAAGIEQMGAADVDADAMSAAAAAASTICPIAWAHRYPLRTGRVIMLNCQYYTRRAK